MYFTAHVSSHFLATKKGRAPRGSVKPLKYITAEKNRVLMFSSFKPLKYITAENIFYIPLTSPPSLWGGQKKRLTAQNNAHTHASTQSKYFSQIYHPNVSNSMVRTEIAIKMSNHPGIASVLDW